MLLSIALIVVAMIGLAALELWLFWWLDERDDRRRAVRQGQNPAPRPPARLGKRTAVGAG